METIRIKTNFFQVFLVNFAWISVFNGYNIVCKQSFQLENALYCHFNEFITRNLRFKKAT